MNEVAARTAHSGSGNTSEIASENEFGSVLGADAGVETRLYITQSPFYSPAFNGAIFDGPLRLYFTQSQEALALKFYFELRSKTQGLGDCWPRATGPNLFVMLYPTEETFDLCFLSQGLSWTADSLPMGRLGRDHVIALQAHELSAEDASVSGAVDRVSKVIAGLKN